MFTAIKIKTVVFWVVTPYNVFGDYQAFRGEPASFIFSAYDINPESSILREDRGNRFPQKCC
jgi:hypothetical protein